MNSNASSPTVPSPSGLGPAGSAAPGYDHDWFGFQPIPERSVSPWPGGRPVAIAVLLDVRAAEWESVKPAVPVPGGRGIAPYPDYPRLSHREFGHRVGVWRLSSLLGDLDIPWTAVLDVLTAEHYDLVRSLVVDQASQTVAGGLSASRPITSVMTLDEEHAYVRSTLRRLEQATGSRPSAWMGPGWSQSAHTPGVLADEGVELMLDWGNDELPYPIVGARPLWAVPVAWELTDVAAMFERDVEPRDYAESIEAAVDTLSTDGRQTPRMACLHLHPWLSGEPFRTRALRPVLDRLARRDDVWLATPEQIAAHVAGGV
ncbi:MAG: hypothetical protein JWM84_1552 [Nocardioides sp.]|nr:hypothetical protein [Nocardioides sp.]